MAAVGDALLSAFFGVLFEKLASINTPGIFRGRAIENDLKRLKKTLKNVEAFLNDAEDKQLKSKAVKKWLDDLKDAAYDAEDVLDEFASEALRRKLEAESSQSSSIQLWSSAMSAYLNPSKIRIESKIKAINKRLDYLAEERCKLGLEEVAAGTQSIEIRRETSSVMGESPLFGRDADQKRIIQWMLKDSETKFSIISIIAMGGIGKTALAQIVYNDNTVKEHFDLKAWVCVSDDFDPKRITKDILYDFTSQASDSDSLNQVQVKLEKVLTPGKKFLIVFDDVWSRNYRDWDVLQNPFKAGAAGSKIIVTTRERDVALMMGTTEYHYLKPLSHNDCWSVFVRHAFVNRDIDTELAVIGKKLVEKCKGLPLAAKMLGGLLRSKLEKDEWEDILNSKIWEPEVVDDILPVLRLSYHHLPSYLKRCFTYCAILPKDYEFREMELVLLWMAEGLVQQLDNKKQLEVIGLRYFRELRSRSFFQPSSSDESLFVMHDLINDLAQWVAGKTCFRLEDNKLEGKEKCFKKARHSSYVGSRHDGVKKFRGFDEVKSLRTFLPLMTPKHSFLTRYVAIDLLPKLSCLRVLSLSGYYITELPDSIDNLKHLRYLDLSRTQIKSLPESTSTLYNLQTLIFKECSSLGKLPAKMRNLINLRHLDITHANSIKEMPPGVGKLTSLRKLSDFIVARNGGSAIGELGNLNHLCDTLRISRLENVIQARDAREAQLKDKHDLIALTMEWSSNFNHTRVEGVENIVLDMLQPHKKLEQLTIKCYGGTRLSTWMGDPSFSNMGLVQLENCVKCTSLPPLGQLPSLKVLRIKGMNKVNCVGLEFYGEGCPKPFPLLETLCFDDMQEWKDWIHFGADRQVEIFPCLRELSIKRCRRLLGKLPERIPSLEKLIIHSCRNLAISISSLQKLCELEIKDCGAVVDGDTVGLSSLKSMVLSSISKFPRLSAEGFVQGLTKVEDLTTIFCPELWQKEVGLLQHLTSLCRLKIESCSNFTVLVEEEEEEIEHHQQRLPCKLRSLELNWCCNLEKLYGLHSLTSLRELTICGAKTVVSFPASFFPPMLRELKIHNCKALKSLPLATMHNSNYASLEHLRIYQCGSLTFIARDQLPSTLKTLDIENCKNLSSLLEEEDDCSLHNSNTSIVSLLEKLYINGCPSLKSLLSRGGLPSTLKHLRIWDCPKLESVAERFLNNTSLEVIRIWKCESLKSIPEGLHNLNHLSSISICECPSLVSFPDEGFPATCLRQLKIDWCETLQALPHSMHNLTSLQEMIVQNCPAGIVSFPEEGFPTNLTLLEIRDVEICKPLLEWDLHLLTSLQRLVIVGVSPDLVSFPEEEKGMILPSTLTSLSIGDFPKLECLSSKGFQNLTLLEFLEISNCPLLKTFLEEGPPLSLLQLRFSGCHLIEKRCRKNQGIYWHKIAHIPCVDINDRFIYDCQEEESRKQKNNSTSDGRERRKMLKCANNVNPNLR